MQMKITIALFCFFMTGLTVWNCWVKPDTNTYKLIASLITVGSGISGFFVLKEMMPTPASPEVNDVFFYANGSQNDFFFCCEFLARNEGSLPCSIDNVEFLLSGIEFKRAKSALVMVGQGGGGGGGLYGGSGGPVKNETASSFFPQTIASMNQSFKIVGKGTSKTLTAKNFTENEMNIEIKFHFTSKNNPIILKRTIPIINKQISGVRF